MRHTYVRNRCYINLYAVLNITLHLCQYVFDGLCVSVRILKPTCIRMCVQCDCDDGYANNETGDTATAQLTHSRHTSILQPFFAPHVFRVRPGETAFGGLHNICLFDFAFFVVMYAFSAFFADPLGRLVLEMHLAMLVVVIFGACLAFLFALVCVMV